ncbi:MAG: pyruvate carboxylase [Deltaproteobacteria bacterium]|nr:pyruvate carboxylase [Deltaproteobacteria bacterium]
MQLREDLPMVSRLMVANRGEIAIRVFRACTELGIRTVALYSEEDRLALHRYKADEAYLVGKGKTPVAAYLDIEDVIRQAHLHDVQAIHPGYGFLSENPEFARACKAAGLIFIGPEPEVLEKMGDKQKARKAAQEAGVPVVPGSEGEVSELEEAREICSRIGYPVMIKAVAGGGGRGMRKVQSEKELEQAMQEASREAKAAFGNAGVFIEKLVDAARHIEVQVLGDKHGNIVHLFERDCTVQRRHQKVVEIAPAQNLSPQTTEKLFGYALSLARHVNYTHAGTVEFLLDTKGVPYFIEMNPRIQVEHTVTEEITGRDLVIAQILIAQGYRLSDSPINISGQDAITLKGAALQCRVTTEDPNNNFMPDTGRILAYRTGAGPGIRLDGSTAGEGHRISLSYDSLLFKITARALTFPEAVAKMHRSLREFRVRGVKTNIPFLENVIQHPSFLSGEVTTSFIDDHPELIRYSERKDRATKILNFLGSVTVNHDPHLKVGKGEREFLAAPIPDVDCEQPPPEGTRQLLEKMGPTEFAKWIRNQERLLITDTTFRDAHQSLMATRARTYDLLAISPATARMLPNLFSMEVWGGATFDVAYRFLKESPWKRLEKLRQEIPNILFQMLLRGSNAVGYTAYPDNVVRHFIRQAADCGIDLFRIFDSLNWVENMKVAIEEVLKTGKIAEGSICYTGDLTNPNETKYTLDYYLNMARELESLGVHIIAIKDMAGLCKPYAAEKLVKALRENVKLPVHFHTHDTSGNGLTSFFRAAEAGVDIVDCAISSMSGLTSQPNMNSLAAAMKGSSRDPELDAGALQELSSYWHVVRSYYFPLESGLNSAAPDVYEHEIPGGQYSNLVQQIQDVGLSHRWEEVKRTYREVNTAFGNIVKVTPTSKAVGDMALALVSGNMTAADLDDESKDITFPDSVVKLFSGHMGQPMGGFPEKLQKRILKGNAPLKGRPGEQLLPADMEGAREKIQEQFGVKLSERELSGYLLYPQVFTEFMEFYKEYGDPSNIDTPTFFYGLRVGEETQVEIEKGKSLIITLQAISQIMEGGYRTIYFDMNGRPREVTVHDDSVPRDTHVTRKGDPHDAFHVVAPMPGKLSRLEVAVGEKVTKGEVVAITEAMKIENAVSAKTDGVVKEILLQPGDPLDAGDLIMELGTS